MKITSITPRLLCILIVGAMCGRVWADDSTSSPSGKSQYTLFNPAPASELRDFNTDRPDVTESPFSVDAGHFQLEFSFLEYTYDDDRGTRTDFYNALPANLRVGILNNTELDLIVSPYQYLLTRGKTPSVRSSGFGDTEVRAKINFWGNDGGTTAFGIIPFVDIPTGASGLSDHHAQGGAIFPLNVNLPQGFDLGAEVLFQSDRNIANTGDGMDFIHTITVDHELFIEPLSAYIEYVGISPVNTGRTYLAYFDTGALYAINKNLQVDAGINIGLSGRAADFTVFSGLSFRW